ncbi:MAG: molybdenum cofactor guanylyltransferase MobA [Pseudomonadota bacterium]
MSQIKKITAVILAGGKGSRMGGIDKGLVDFNGEALIKPIIKALAPHVDQLIINANRNIEAYQQLGYTVVSDADNNFLGPLAGFLAAMKEADTQELVFVPCDGPLLKGELMQRLINARRNSSTDIAVAHDGKRMQPVYVSLLKSLEHSLEAYLQSGERKIDRWYQQHDLTQVDCSDIQDCFININTLEQRNQLEQGC